LPVSNIIIDLGALVIGGMVAVPFIWPEMKLLFKL
jgi:hypothetical protein